MAKNKTNWTESFWLILLAPLLLLAILLWLVFSAILFPFSKIYEQWLRHLFWQRHGRFGRLVLFVYSDSPNWKDYIEENILPRIESHVVILNWSKRREWDRTSPFEAKVFYRWAGKTEFNPTAIILPPHGKVKEVRFWQAFKDFKHGKDRLLKEAEKILFDEVEKYVAKAI